MTHTQFLNTVAQQHFKMIISYVKYSLKWLELFALICKNRCRALQGDGLRFYFQLVKRNIECAIYGYV